MVVATSGRRDGIEWSTRVRPKPGEPHAGDATLVVAREHDLLFAIVDVLGHGPQAHRLAVEIETYLKAQQRSCRVLESLQALHQQFRLSRGAAVGLVALEPLTGAASFAGVGNTVTRCVGRASERLLSRDGVLGTRMRRPHEQAFRLEPGDTLLMYTDGISSRFSVSAYPRLGRQEPGTVAAAILGRFARATDDAACIVARRGP